MKKIVQYFSPEYLKQCQTMSTLNIVKFLEDFRKLHANRESLIPTKSRLISIKIPTDLLDIFRKKSELHGVRYQTQIKQLMREWILK
ncbi:hypothetical protein WDW37_09155 [Bdellovibrionota bacterium FG-1]